MAQFSGVEEEGPHSFPLQMAGREGKSLGLVFLENSFWWDPKPLPWHGADLLTDGRAPFWRLDGGVQVGIAAVDAVNTHGRHSFQ